VDKSGVALRAAPFAHFGLSPLSVHGKSGQASAVAWVSRGQRGLFRVVHCFQVSVGIGAMGHSAKPLLALWATAPGGVSAVGHGADRAVWSLGRSGTVNYPRKPRSTTFVHRATTPVLKILSFV
jgi:hypothetical protein